MGESRGFDELSIDLGQRTVIDSNFEKPGLIPVPSMPSLDSPTHRAASCPADSW